MVRLTFGVTSSPFLATKVLRQAATVYKDKYPEVAAIIRHLLYVDDCIASANSEDDAIHLRQPPQQHLHEWWSNNKRLLDTIPEELKETETMQHFFDLHKVHVATPPQSTILQPTKHQIALGLLECLTF